MHQYTKINQSKTECKTGYTAKSADLFEAKICFNWPQKNQPRIASLSLHSVLFYFAFQVTSGISISTLETQQERTSRFYLRVEWTSALRVFTKIN